ncbi:MmyB family transcriptional regulator [Plantactinospora sonchi]|uniref:MmyB-like transcription regulator ligand binding domain-containing protein n=1 Tax=Plantactinospora sonchi TaxID=1544735 RepID=A0ABU7RXL1_9ACTN
MHILDAEIAEDRQLRGLAGSAMILHCRMGILAWNRAATALLIDLGTLPPRERDYIRLTFLDEDSRNLLVDWPVTARECVAVLRREAGQHRADRDLNDLVTELDARSAEFRG